MCPSPVGVEGDFTLLGRTASTASTGALLITHLGMRLSLAKVISISLVDYGSPLSMENRGKNSQMGSSYRRGASLLSSGIPKEGSERKSLVLHLD